jgi:DDE family transposase
VRAQEGGLIGDRPEAAIDATGLESRHTSRYFFKRAGRKHSARLWTKLTVVCHTASHFFTAATVSAGPSNDAPQFRPALCQASLAVRWRRLLADAAFDSEANHRLCREALGIRSTVIPINRRAQGRKWPKTRYRRQMKKRFPKRKYGQRWQAESAFSRHKRLLDSALRSRSEPARERECYLRVLTHNLMLLAATGQ